MRVLLAVCLGLTLAMGTALGQASKEERTSVLKFGIETEVLELVRALRQEKNPDYRALLLEAYDHARNDELKEALILFFSELKDNGLEDRTIAEITQAEKKGNSLLLNAVSYLTEIKSLKVRDTLANLTLGKNKVLALSAIRALGKLGATDHADDLLKLYKDAETDPNYKPDLIWAFGEMRAGSAVETLVKEYEENEAQPLLRRSILEALAKIGASEAWDLVEAALTDTNTDLRAAAVATLGSFPQRGDQVNLLTAALRDAQPSVRLAAAQAAKVQPRNELKDVLSYRVKKDPDPKVRVAALQALAAYGDGPSVVLGFLADRKTDNTVWREALNLSLDKKYSGTYDALKTVLTEDAKDKTSVLAPLVAQAILPQKETYRALYGLLLASEKVPARATALRAISLGKFTEFESVLRTLEAKDPDPGVKAQAAAILKEWGKTEPTEPAKK